MQNRREFLKLTARVPAQIYVSRMAALLVGTGSALVGLSGCQKGESGEQQSFAFRNVAHQAGLDFVHQNGASRPLDILRTTGPGLAWLDYDRDGWPDLFCVNGNPPGANRGASRGHRLYRNRRDGTFEDVTDRAGLRGLGQDGMGVAIGDYDGDGWPDIYITCYGPNHLYRNRGDGAFEDVTDSAGVGGGAAIKGYPKWSTSAAWFDATGDGLLDLYVTNYCAFGPGASRLCSFGEISSACSPTVYSGQPDLFFRNQGNGRFVQDTKTFSIHGRPPGRGLGVLPFDANGDGLTDLFVANDGGGDFFFHNLGGGRFEEIAYSCGLALDGSGSDPSGMGVDVVDYEGSGRPDLVVSNFQGLANIFYHQVAPLVFQDASATTGLALSTRNVLSFGAGFVDFDLDGLPELLFINGHVQDNISQISGGVSYAQPPQLFRYKEGVFEDLSASAGPVFLQGIVGRGSAYADYDRDGVEEVAVAVNGGAVQLWRNECKRGHWLQVDMRGKRPNTQAIGSQVTLHSGGKTQVRQVLTGRSYLSDSERVLTFGLGTAVMVDRLEIRWPDGSRQVVPVTGVDRRLTIEQGKTIAQGKPIEQGK